MQFQVIGFDRVFFDPTHRLAQQPRMKTETLFSLFSRYYPGRKKCQKIDFLGNSS